MDTPSPRRYLLINPNTNPLTTKRLQEVLLPKCRQVFSCWCRRPDLVPLTSPAKPAMRWQRMLVWIYGTTQRGTPEQPLDGVLIGCFGDPGLFALREVSGCPVTGLAEASFIQAAALGPFAIVTGGERWKPMLHRLANSLGYGAQLRHIETVAPTGAALQADPDMAIRCLTKLASKQRSRCGRHHPGRCRSGRLCPAFAAARAPALD
jgi:allantoin racemase